MKNAVWATFYHKRSTDEELRQGNPLRVGIVVGSGSRRTFRYYQYRTPIHEDVSKTICTVYFKVNRICENNLDKIIWRLAANAEEN
ncbi:hypothetical protein V1478_001688 [Vespula squamosa]